MTTVNMEVHIKINNEEIKMISSSKSFINDLCSLVGNQNVSTNYSAREQHGKDEGPHSVKPPDIVVWPQNTNQVSKVAQLCYKNSIPMIPYGTGTGVEGGVSALQGGVCIDLGHMNNVCEVNPEDFDVTVQAGVTRLSLNNYIKDTGLWFPVDPGADASLGGMSATSASGTTSVKYGTMKENVLNLKVVLADGTVLHTSGEGKRTRKSSAGYNLTSLFVGSEGTLGIITEVTLKLHGLPEKIVSAICTFPSVKAAVDTTIQLLQNCISVARIELLDEISVEAANKYSKVNYKIAPTLFLEFHGSPAEVHSQVQIVGDIAAANEGSDFTWSEDTETRNKLWKARHQIYYATLAIKPNYRAVITDVCVPISKLPEVIMKAKEDIQNSGLTGSMLGHVGDGNFHSLILFHPNSKDLLAANAVAVKIAEHAIEVGGTCTGEHGIGIGKLKLLKDEYGDAGISVMKCIKKALDPKNLMNPGKVIDMDNFKDSTNL